MQRSGGETHLQVGHPVQGIGMVCIGLRQGRSEATGREQRFRERQLRRRRQRHQQWQRQQQQGWGYEGRRKGFLRGRVWLNFFGFVFFRFVERGRELFDCFLLFREKRLEP